MRIGTNDGTSRLRASLVRSVAGAACLLSFAAASFGCHRPVGGRDASRVIVRDLRVEPAFLRRSTPFEISFTVSGSLASSVAYSVGERPLSCDLRVEDERRYFCRHPGFSFGEIDQGTARVAVDVHDQEGRVTRAETDVVIDFECPVPLRVSIEPAIAALQDRVVLELEASEVLATPPKVTRGDEIWTTEVSGSEASYSMTHEVTSSDRAGFIDLLVTLTDRAGNSSDDCGASRHVSFAVDLTPPTIHSDGVLVEALDAAGRYSVRTRVREA